MVLPKKIPEDAKDYNMTYIDATCPLVSKVHREAENLHKFGYRYFNLLKRSKKDKKVIKSFQQHFLPNNVSGKIDQKTFKISHFLNQ